MTADATPTGIVYTVTSGDAGQEYPINFPFIAAADVKAYYLPQGAKRDATVQLVYGADYRVTEQVFTTFTALPVGASLAIYRETPLTQEILWVSGQAIHAPSIMKADDKLTFILQEMAEDVNRAFKINAEEEAGGMTPDAILQSVYDARDGAASSARAAEESASAAVGSASVAADSATDAEGSASSAARSASSSAGSAATAASSAELARQWAENPEDSAITPDHYSAYHWAKKALENSASGETLATVNGLEPDEDKNVQIIREVTQVDFDALKTGGVLSAGAEYVITDKEAPSLIIVGASGRVYDLSVGQFIIGEIRLLPFRPADLPEAAPGWHFCNGDRYPPPDSPQGEALLSLSAHFRAGRFPPQSLPYGRARHVFTRR